MSETVLCFYPGNLPANPFIAPAPAGAFYLPNFFSLWRFAVALPPNEWYNKTIKKRRARQ